PRFGSFQPSFSSGDRLLLIFLFLLGALALVTRSGAGQTIGAEARVSAPLSFYQTEPSVAALGDRAVAVWERGHDSYRVGWAYTTDAGATWTDGGSLQPDNGTELPWDHPSIRVTSAGDFYAASQFAAEGSSSYPDGYSIAVWRGSFQGNGFSWSAPVLALPMVFTYQAYRTCGWVPYDAPQISC